MALLDKKKWYLSMTIWAAVASSVITILSEILGADHRIVIMLMMIASAFGIYGRVTATSKIK